jgi:hypothetical protein
MNKKSKSKKPNSRTKKIALIVGLAALASGIIFIIYFFYSSIHSWQPNPNDYDAAINNKDLVITENSKYYSVLPKNGSVNDGVIIYQGAFADAKSYIAPYSKLVDSGIGIFILRSPFGFALFNVAGANQVINENPDIKTWYVAGHSLGGVAACEYAKTNTSKINGLILLASFCNGNATNLNTPVLSISGSNDGLSTPQKIDNSRSKLPSNTKFVVIDGANHTEFGDFEKLQPGDNETSVSQAEATSQINSAIINFIK